MKSSLKTIFLIASFAIILACATVTAAPAPPGDGIKTIDVPGAGHIMYGPLAGQLTPQSAIGRVLQVVSQHSGERPEITKILKSDNADILAAFFNVTAKNQDGRKLSGLVIASAPKSGPAAAVLLYDDASRFPTSFDTLFKRLQKELAASPSALGPPPTSSPSASSPGSSSPSSLPAATAPAAALQPFQFPDGTGAIGLPAGWNVASARKADILAKGPNGEILRFGLFVSIVDPRDARSSTLGPMRNGTGPGDFLAIPFNADATTAFKSASAQLAMKAHRQPATLNIAKVQQVPTSGGGRIFLYSGEVDSHDGKGPVYFVARVIMSAQMSLGSWAMTIYQVNIPKQLYAQEANTIAHVFQSYNVNEGAMLGIIHSEMAETQRITNDFIAWSNKLTESSDRSTAGFCDYLLEKTVIKSNDTGNHYRTSDGTAQWLIDSGHFEAVPLSQYIKGIDFD